MEQLEKKEKPVDKLFTEKYRPKELRQFMTVKRVRDIVFNLLDVDGKLVQNPLFYSVSPGTGKTTLTRLLTQNCDCLKLNASKDRGIDTIRNSVYDFIHTCSIISDKPKVVIFEEMDGMTDQAFDALRAIIEEAGDVRFIGNCNDISKIPEPIRSRFTEIPLFPLTREESDELFANYCKWAMALLNRQHITYTDEDVSRLVGVHFPNMRNIVNNIQTCVTSKITDLSQAVFKKEYACEDLFSEVFQGANEDPTDYKVRLYDKIITDYSYRASDAINAFANEFIDFLLDSHPEKKNCIGTAIICIADSMDALTRTTNPKIVLMALIFNLYNILNE